jgi:ParB family chromosome partitioning protein
MSRNRRGGLGRGLGALIPTSAAQVDERSESGSVATLTDPDERRVAAEHAEAQAPAPVIVTVAPADPASARPDAIVIRPESLPAAIDDVSPADARPVDAADDRVEIEAAMEPEVVAEAIDESGPLPVPGARFAELDISSIVANAKQPRQVFDADALAELTHSIREFGVLQPVVVRESGDGYERIMGERRLRAAEAAGLTAIPAIIRDTADDAMLRDALLENIHRASLNPLEEAAAYQQLLEEFGTTHEELATRIGRSRSQVSNTIRLLNLPVAVQRRVAAGVLSAGHARALLGLKERDQQDELAARIVAEGLSVRATEELVALAANEAPAKPARSAPTRRFTAPAITELADRLADTFETRVRVELGRRKGKITVEFASVDDLERIIALMAPQLATKPRPTPTD